MHRGKCLIDLSGDPNGRFIPIRSLQLLGEAIELAVEQSETVEELDIDNGRNRLSRLCDEDRIAAVLHLVQEFAQPPAHRHRGGFS